MPQPWETKYGKPDRICSAQNIMLEAPIGAAAFNNEFGRPVLSGYFRTLEQNQHEIIKYRCQQLWQLLKQFDCLEPVL